MKIFIYNKWLSSFFLRFIEAGVLILIVISFSTYGQHKNNVSNFRVKTVVIDAGHGGKDPGAVNGKTYEKDITLAIALKLGRLIKSNLKDIRVIYTRDTDEFIELYERANIANRNKANLFISIHCNTGPLETMMGTETYAMGIEKNKSNLEVSKRENSVVMLEENYLAKYDGFDPNSPEGHIIFSLYQNAYLDQSLNMASKVENQMKLKAMRNSRGVKQAGFLVLWKTAMPSILFEAGFLSNPEEKKFLLSDTGQTKIATSIYKAFKEFKSELEVAAN
jgi:N-acetylmuramoyl-L-alanine amidase